MRNWEWSGCHRETRNVQPVTVGSASVPTGGQRLSTIITIQTNITIQTSKTNANEISE